MRFRLSSNKGKLAGKLAFAALLASAATSCSSGATRFDGIFSKSDQMTTGSIPRQSNDGYAQDPVPRADVAQGDGGYNQSYGNQGYNNQSYNNAPMQTYPSAPSYSSARQSASPIQRSELAAPGASASSAPMMNRQPVRAQTAQQFPAQKQHMGSLGSAPSTLHAPQETAQAASSAKSSGWSSVNAPSVTVRPGETVATLSRRYGVPEAEIMKVNGLKKGVPVAPGRQIVIPTYNGGSPAKASTQSADISKSGNTPMPGKAPQQQEAMVAPAGGSLRAKSDLGAPSSGDKLAAGGKGPGEGGYTVKPGDSLAKIAKENGVSVADLKAANGITNGGIRIGQVLAMPHGGEGADSVKTASISKSAPKEAAPASAAPEKAEVTPVKASPSESVSNAVKADTSAAPEGTGIGKYRWPVRGAVVAGYGANVKGSRNDGIDISVPQGTPIKAAENGVVIYAGSGLKELGNTVLVRHDDGTVTVYGYADKLDVQRGQKIQRGDTLATSGMSGNATQPQVHFEVRKNATPVNPMTFLE